MNISPETRKLMIWVIGFFLLISLGLLLFHQHPDGGHDEHCLICRLVQYIALIFVPLVAIFNPVANRTCSALPVKKLASFFVSDTRQGRAPPKI